MSNLKCEIVISVQIWGLLSFRNTSREGSIIYSNYYLNFISTMKQAFNYKYYQNWIFQ
jgi:hypothetical protein